MKKFEKKALGRGLRALVSPETVSVNNFNNEDLLKKDFQSLSEPLTSSSAAYDLNSESEHLNLSTPQINFINIDQVLPNPEQPRKEFDVEELSELVSSISTLGVLQPILVRPYGDDYQIVAGERRWRAATQAGLKKIPAIIKDFDARETLQVSIVENVQRQQLNPIEEAKAYQQLIEEFNYSQEEVAELVGKNRVTVANSLRLLKLDLEILSLVEQGHLSTGHAKVILGVKDQLAQKSLAKRITTEGLSVRALEKLVPQMMVLDRGKRVTVTSKPILSIEQNSGDLEDSNFPHVISRIVDRLGTKVSIKHSDLTSEGKIVISYYSDQDLDRLVNLICDDELHYK
jgi:ParB family transcriptional regulator, chromosome partitioning protein